MIYICVIYFFYFFLKKTLKSILFIKRVRIKLVQKKMDHYCGAILEKQRATSTFLYNLYFPQKNEVRNVAKRAFDAC